MAPKSYFTKYQASYAESEAHAVFDRAIPQVWDRIVTIPAYGEDELLPAALRALAKAARADRVLCVVVVNHRADSPAYIAESNNRLLRHLREGASAKEDWGPHLHLWRYAPNLDLLVINRASPPQLFPAGQGVGLARKIAGDVAVALHAKGCSTSPWVHCTDGDTQVGCDYFTVCDAVPAATTSAIIHPFRHLPGQFTGSDEHWHALRLYETWLHYYREGLEYSGSPYAFITIGSLITFNPLHYAMARGFPRREAGEDFYFLNKLAKLGAVHSVSGEPVLITDREWVRVPFGTTAGKSKIRERLLRGEAYEIYHPDAFRCLRVLLTACRTYLEHGDESRFWSEVVSGLPPTLNEERWRRIVKDAGFPEGLALAKRRSTNAAGAWREFHGWFDAFKTLKLIHALRDELLPNIPISPVFDRFLANGQKGVAGFFSM